jgi:translation initiation factor 4A
LGIIGSGRGVTNAEATQAREWKLDALADLFQDIEINQAIVHVGSMATLEAVVYKLATRGLETISVVRSPTINAGSVCLMLTDILSTLR